MLSPAIAARPTLHGRAPERGPDQIILTFSVSAEAEPSTGISRRDRGQGGEE
jgi:hypothetical protein